MAYHCVIGCRVIFEVKLNYKMPRIDPSQLLNCLSVLLSPSGGIKSRDEVQRLASLMTKFSKKLVSKCIYVQILKHTETELLGLFMGSGGWLLLHVWLAESITTQNWPLGIELLELLLLCPVDLERLKSNNVPKLVKELSKDGTHFVIRALAVKLVGEWLRTVKGEEVVPPKVSALPQILSEAISELEAEASIKTECQAEHDNNTEIITNSEVCIILEKSISNDVDTDIKIKEEADDEPETLPVLKISLRDGKQVISQVDDSESKTCETLSDSEKSKDKAKSRSKDKSDDKNSTTASKSSSSSKNSNRSHSSSEKHKTHKSSSSRHNSSKDRSKDKDRHSSHSSSSRSGSSRKNSDKLSSSSSKLKEDRRSRSSSEKDKSRDRGDKSEKSKDTSLRKSSSEKPDDMLPSVHKLGKIPKLSDSKKEKPSISIEVRKPDEPKPKTVKTFNSKFRKHGLEEEVKPPPSRAAVLTKKSTPVLPPTVSIPKRSSPVHNEAPPEKKPKTIVEIVEKPGAIKLIPPKPKPILLLESDMFMDALNASATNKRDPKKRKRRTSGSKDGNSGNDASPPHTPTNMSSPNSESKSVPPRFYQDTLETEDNKEKVSEKDTDTNEEVEEQDIKKEIVEEMDTSEPHTITINGLKGVLCYHKRKGPKKSIKWKPDSELEEIQYFELDETERVNVTKTFTDMKYLERIHERDAFQKGRNISNDDVMEEKTNWRPLILVDADGQVPVDHGKSSKEKDIQAIRQKGTLQPLYFSKSMIPDSAFEPEPETHPYTEPTIIPLEDVTGNQDNISDFRTMPWPEPKGNAPPASATITVPNMFPPNMNQFPNSFPNPQFPGVPGFQGGTMVPGEWPSGVPPHMMGNGMPGPMAPGPIPPGNLPPGMMMPLEGMMMPPEMFGAPNPMFPGPPEGFNMQQNMFPMDFNPMSGPQGPPPGPDGFPGMVNFRGAMRGRGAGGHWRGKNAGGWDGPPRGRGGARGSRKAVCMYFQRKGSCRQGDNCTFLHPGVNCPF